MNKFMKVLAASALIATTLVGCGGKDNAKYAKVGLGVITSPVDEEKGQINTYFATVGLDSDDKIAFVDIDVAQSTPSKGEDAVTQTKKELKDDYKMKGNSKIGKEWYEQIAAFEEYIKGKTKDEVTGIETNEVDGHNVANTTEDLYSGCTMEITGYQEVVAKAIDNAVAVEGAEKIGMGRSISVKAPADEKPGQVDTTISAVATDADGKVVWTQTDVAQIKDDGKNLKTKLELKDDYNMKDASALMERIEGGAEWYQQIAAFDEYVTGKTKDEVAGIELVEVDGHNVASTTEDLYSGCTMDVETFQKTVVQAIEAAQ